MTSLAQMWLVLFLRSLQRYYRRRFLIYCASGGVRDLTPIFEPYSLMFDVDYMEGKKSAYH